MASTAVLFIYDESHEETVLSLKARIKIFGTGRKDALIP
jgi:hypothetical protein